MKQFRVKWPALIAALAFLVPSVLLAQDDKDKVVKEEKVVKEKEKKDAEQIVITRKGDKNEKIVVEIVGDKITVNGKPIEELKDGDVTVSQRRLKDGTAFYWDNKAGTAFNLNNNDNFRVFSEESNHAMLGVSTEKSESGGVKIVDITPESAASKIGLKEGDVITKIDETKIEDSEGLTKAIRSHKPGDKVAVTYLRDKKEQKATAELTKFKTNFKMDIGDLNLSKMPRATVTPRVYNGQNYSWSGGSPKLGLSVQDTDDGKGVKVIEVDEDSNAAKAGVKENDVISEVDGKAINSTDEMVKMIKESKDKNSIMVKLTRAGKVQNIEVKMPKKIKTADL